MYVARGYSLRSYKSNGGVSHCHEIKDSAVLAEVPPRHLPFASSAILNLRTRSGYGLAGSSSRWKRSSKKSWISLDRPFL